MKTWPHLSSIPLSVLLFCATGLCAGLPAEGQGAQAPAGGSGRVAVLIGFRNVPGPSEQALVRSQAGAIKYSYHLVPAIAASIPEQARAALLANPAVTRIEADGTVRALDAELDSSWGVKRIGAGLVHDAHNKGTGVKVAVIDTGIDRTHPDLDANYKGGRDFVNNDDDPMDDHGHGTHVAGTIAAEDNGTGVVGVAPEAHLYALKILDSSGSGSDSDLIAAMQWAVDNHMDVVNMSLGTPTDPGTAVQQAFDNAAAAGVLSVAAAGNSDFFGIIGDTVEWPARYESVIAVGATDSTDSLAWFSSTGPQVELAAPGVSIRSTLRGGGYGNMDGTSMATPHVAGTAALVIAAGWSDVRGRLASTADDLAPTGRDTWYGFGLVDADEAAASTGPVEPPVLTTIEVSPSSVALYVGQTQQFAANGKDQYGDPIDAGTVTWQSSNTTAGSISSGGLFTASSAGSTTITATGSGGVFGTASVTVQAAPVLTTIEVSPSAVTLDVGQTQQFTANGKDQYGDPINTGAVTWQSADTTVGTISPTGLFTASSAGSTTITATGNGGVSGTASVTVRAAPVVPTMHVGSITLTREKLPVKKGSALYRVTASVLILDASGAAVSGAEVRGNWSGAYTANDVSAITIGGTARFTTASVQAPKGSTFTFTVADVVKSGWAYNPSANTETTDSITVR